MPTPVPPSTPDSLPREPPGPQGRQEGPRPQEQVVFWHGDAPAQPAMGQPCNGCGLCCLAEPCPLGMLVSRRRHGACVALRWLPGTEPAAEADGTDTAGGATAEGAGGRLDVPEAAGGARPAASGQAGRYVCGMVADPAGVTGWRNRWLLRALARLARRWIAAGQGCDAPPLQVTALREGSQDGEARS